ncbi:SDR family NAD(P)-dependent oxidoreductase [Amorphus sp. 3PC139-8]|uniref:SDR family NAD(P)-dependent oxidoreductase n=1 Tax=Amorphus sp. 3PC139-8 TaxID=2735676 RepID=UPI00345C7431
MQSIEGQVAIVTGASSGIGRGIAVELAAAGAFTVLAARSADKLETLVGDIEAAGGRAISVPTDVTREADVVRLFETTVARAGAPKILVNNAGIADATPTDELSLSRWHEMIETNLTSAFLCSREAMRLMKPAGGGRIINIGSISAKSPRPNSIAYTASKFGLEGLTRSLALDGRDFNIAASALNPGATISSLVPGQTDQPAADRIVPEDVGKIVVMMASLPPEITMIESTVVPLKVPFFGRG